MGNHCSAFWNTPLATKDSFPFHIINVFISSQYPLKSQNPQNLLNIQNVINLNLITYIILVEEDEALGINHSEDNFFPSFTCEHKECYLVAKWCGIGIAQQLQMFLFKVEENEGQWNHQSGTISNPVGWILFKGLEIILFNS